MNYELLSWWGPEQCPTRSKFTGVTILVGTFGHILVLKKYNISTHRVHINTFWNGTTLVLFFWASCRNFLWTDSECYYVCDLCIRAVYVIYMNSCRRVMCLHTFFQHCVFQSWTIMCILNYCILDMENMNEHPTNKHVHENVTCSCLSVWPNLTRTSQQLII